MTTKEKRYGGGPKKLQNNEDRGRHTLHPCIHLSQKEVGSILFALNDDNVKLHHKKTFFWDFQAGLTQTRLLLQQQKMDRGLKFWIKEEEGFYYLCRENKGTHYNCLVTVQLICAFVFAHANRFCHDAAQLVSYMESQMSVKVKL